MNGYTRSGTDEDGEGSEGDKFWERHGGYLAIGLGAIAPLWKRSRLVLELFKDCRELSERGTNFLIAQVLVMSMSVAPNDVAVGCDGSKFVSGGSIAAEDDLNVLRD